MTAKASIHLVPDDEFAEVVDETRRDLIAQHHNLYVSLSRWARINTEAKDTEVATANLKEAGQVLRKIHYLETDEVLPDDHKAERTITADELTAANVTIIEQLKRETASLGILVDMNRAMGDQALAERQESAKRKAFVKLRIAQGGIKGKRAAEVGISGVMETKGSA